MAGVSVPAVLFGCQLFSPKLRKIEIRRAAKHVWIDFIHDGLWGKHGINLLADATLYGKIVKVSRRCVVRKTWVHSRTLAGLALGFDR